MLGLLTVTVTVSREPTRKDRSLANTFPFNEGEGDEPSNKRWCPIVGNNVLDHSDCVLPGVSTR